METENAKYSFDIKPFRYKSKKTRNTLNGISKFFRDYREIKQQKTKSNNDFPITKFFPCLADEFSEGGTAKGIYFHQDHLVARRIFINNPTLHVDVGSMINGFVAHVASYRTIEVFDIRMITSKVKNIEFKQSDFMDKIQSKYLEYCDSLSSLNAVEHFGLGRYGDPINYNGHLDGLNNLHKILKKGGKFYFSVPIGPQRIEFNAHRVFSVSYLVELLKDRYLIEHFSYVDDNGDLHEDIDLSIDNSNENFGCNYGCGIFEMTKK